MDNLGELKAVPKTGNEQLSLNGTWLNYNLRDFWRWSVSDILSNATRGRLAEFIVGTAIGLSPEDIRDEWGAWDLTSDDGIKIEIKSASFIQSWIQRKFSSISFSIKPTLYWDSETNRLQKVRKRHADMSIGYNELENAIDKAYQDQISEINS